MQVRLMNITSPQFTAGNYDKIKASSNARRLIELQLRNPQATPENVAALVKARDAKAKRKARLAITSNNTNPVLNSRSKLTPTTFLQMKSSREAREIVSEIGGRSNFDTFRTSNLDNL